jgi:branched-chain amino acid transport system substrate-binding protein
MTRLPLLSFLALLGLSGPAAADILLGAAAPLSGPNAALGEQLRRGVQLAVDDINATGGLRGERLSVSFADDGCDPRKAVEAAVGFVSMGARAIIGHYCSGASIPASKVYEKAGLVQISPASSHPKFTEEGGWNVIRLVPRDDAQGAAAADLVIAHFAGRKIAVLDDQSPGGKAQARSFTDRLSAKGVTPVLQESYKPGAKDYRPLAARIGNAGAEVVYLAGSYVESGMIVRQLRDLGSGAQFIGGDLLVTEDFSNIAKNGGEGTLMSFTYDPRKFEAARPVLERFKSADYNAEGFTIYAYAAVQAWVAAAEATGSTDSTRVAQWLRSGTRIPTAAGEVSFNAKGDLVNPRYAWFKWIDGRYVEIDPATLEPPQLDTTPSP